MKESSLRLFADASAVAVERAKPAVTSPVAVVPLWSADEQPEIAVKSITSTPIDAAVEQRILAILDEPARPEERAADACRRKEYAVGEIFATLSVRDARALHQRLRRQDTEDPVWQRFARFVPERRGRLLAFLSDAPRREMVARGRR